MTDQAAPLHRFYDRFDLLFYVTVATISLLLLVDLDQTRDSPSCSRLRSRCSPLLRSSLPLRPPASERVDAGSPCS